MKSLLSSYSGGKSETAKMICNMIPSHKVYVEPFFGGGSVFFKKKKAKHEIINDLDNDLYDFWCVVRNKKKELEKKFDKFLYFEDEYKRAKELLKNGDDVERAYAFFLSINMSFSGIIGAGFAYSLGTTDKHSNFSIKVRNKMLSLDSIYKRLKDVVIFNRPALKIIEIYKEASEAFFYLDPPYPETTQAYNHKFNIEDFNQMTELLKTIKGKFLLSCYLKDDMNLDKSWNIKEYKKVLRMGNNNDKHTTEALIYNYDDKEFKDVNLELF